MARGSGRTDQVRTGSYLTCIREATPGMPEPCTNTYYATPSRIKQNPNGSYCSIECKSEKYKIYRLCPECDQLKVQGQDVFCGIDCAVRNRSRKSDDPRKAVRDKDADEPDN